MATSARPGGSSRDKSFPRTTSSKNSRPALGPATGARSGSGAPGARLGKPGVGANASRMIGAKPAMPKGAAPQRPANGAAASAARSTLPGRVNGSAGASLAKRSPARAASGADRPEPKIIFQKYFRSVGPRTYAAQVKELANGNHLLLLTEGKRDAETDEVRKTRVFVYGEDFSAFFKLLQETATFIRANPLSEEVRERRNRFWAKKNKEARGKQTPARDARLPRD